MRESLELTVSLVVIATLTAWGGNEPDAQLSSTIGAVEAQESFPRTVVDDYGGKIYLPEPPGRIASVTLASDEVLLEILPPERLIACTYFARDPGISGCAEQAAKVQKTVNGDVEEIIGLQPDLVIVAGFTPTSNVTLLRGAGLNVFRFGHYDTLEDIRKNIVRLGYMVGAEQRAAELVKRMDQQLASISDNVKTQVRPRVLYYTPDGYTAGLGTVFDDLLEYAGGVNATADAGITGYDKISTEIAISLNPDVVVFAGTFASADGEMQDPLDFLEGQQAWQQTPAVRNRRVYVLSAKSITTISHHVVDGARQLAKLLHPDCFTAEILP